MKMKLLSASILALMLALLLTIVPALAYFNTTSFTGQGFVPARSAVQTEICGVSNGAEVDGPYLLWTLTAPDARNADISGPWGDAIMTHTEQGTFTYISGWYDAHGLAAHPVRAIYDGKPGPAILVVSHGCDPSR